MKALPLMLLVATCWAPTWSQKTTPLPDIPLDDIDKKCLALTKVSKEYLMDFLHDLIDMKTVSPDFKCFTRCILESHNLAKDGVLLEANLLKAAENLTDAAQVRKLIADCGFKKGRDVCETSFNLFVCIYDELA